MSTVMVCRIIETEQVVQKIYSWMKTNEETQETVLDAENVSVIEIDGISYIPTGGQVILTSYKLPMEQLLQQQQQQIELLKSNNAFLAEMLMGVLLALDGGGAIV